MSFSSTKNHYEILNLPRTASQTDIKLAFKRLSLEKHPDKHCNSQESVTFFQNLVAAKEILTDPLRKIVYDRLLARNKHSNLDPKKFQQLVEEEKQRRERNKPEPLIVNYQISLQDQYNFNGNPEKEIETFIRKCICCDQCLGCGIFTVIKLLQPLPRTVCKSCHGVGEKDEHRMIGPGMVQQIRMQCQLCRGSGVETLSSEHSCKKCHGSGTCTTQESFKFVIDLRRGRYPLEKISAGEGHQKVDFQQNLLSSPPENSVVTSSVYHGDLILKIDLQLKDEKEYGLCFERLDKDLRVQGVKISYLESIIGFEKNIPLPNCDTLTIRSKRNKEFTKTYENGSISIIAGKGFLDREYKEDNNEDKEEDNETRGNLIIEWQVEPLPQYLKQKQVEAIIAVGFGISKEEETTTLKYTKDNVDDNNKEEEEEEEKTIFDEKGGESSKILYKLIASVQARRKVVREKINLQKNMRGDVNGDAQNQGVFGSPFSGIFGGMTPGTTTECKQQ